MTDSHQSTAKSTHGDKPRRNFLVEAGSVIVGAVVGMFGLASGLVVFFDPLLRKHKVPELYQQEEGGTAEGYIRVATLDAIPDDGVPRRFPVIADLIDAWNFTPQQPVGAVYLRREKGEKKVTVFHATCPHAGCSVSFSAENHAYYCPCHNSAFDVDGTKINRPGKENPSPRPLDELKVDDDRLAANGEVWVKFVNYYTGIHEQKPKI
jgi:menaquinol-cytochrome c reductase iron-sulfur subunit